MLLNKLITYELRNYMQSVCIFKTIFAAQRANDVIWQFMCMQCNSGEISVINYKHNYIKLETVSKKISTKPNFTL